MANEGFLGRFEFKGERAATDDHPAMIQYVPLAAAAAADIPIGTMMAATVGTEGDVTYAPLLSTDTTAEPEAVVDVQCDTGETSVCVVVHGTVKTRLLTTGDGQAATAKQMLQLKHHGIFAA